MTRVATFMTERNEEGPTRDMLAKTPQDEPTVKIIARPWYHAIGIRVARVYIQTLIGLMTADGVGVVDFDGFAKLAVSAALPATFSLIMNAGEILAKLDTNEHYVAYRG